MKYKKLKLNCVNILAETEHVLAKEKPIAIGDVKSKLKKNSTIINKKGPMKAVHPINNIQRGGIFNLSERFKQVKI